MEVKKSFFEKVKCVIGLDDLEEIPKKENNVTYVQRQDFMNIENKGLENRKKEETVHLELIKPPRIVIKTPTRYSDVTDIVEYFRKKDRVVVDFKNVIDDEKKDMFNFLNGAIFALEGAIEKMDKNKCIYLPDGEIYTEDIKQKFSIK